MLKDKLQGHLPMQW